MAKEVEKLTAVQVHKAKSNLSDGNGLKIRRYCRNGKVRLWWVWRYTSISGRQRDLPIGPVDQSSLAAAGASLKAARLAVADARELLRRNIDPIDHARELREEAQRKEAAKKAEAKSDRLTLRRHAHVYIDKLEGTFRNAKHEKQWGDTVLKLLPASLLDKPIADIKPLELLEALVPVCKRTPETGRRLAQRVRVLFDSAVVEGLREDNPAIPIRAELSRRAGKRKGGHFATLHYRNLPAFVERLRDVEGVSARALEFQILCASRPGEVLKAEWSEFNLDRREWLIPKDRMKREEPHLVFLNDGALRILEGQRGQSEKFVFPAPRTGEPMAIDSLRMVMRRMGTINKDTPEGDIAHLLNQTKATPHGTARRCFKTGSKELALAPKDVIECALAHREKDRTEAAYDLSEFLSERRRLAHVWGEFVEGRWQIPDNVVEFKPKAA